MIIDVRAVPHGHTSQRQTVREFSDGCEWPRFAEGLECGCEIDRTDHEITFRVRFRGTVLLSCSRCLGEFGQEVSGDCWVLARQTADSSELGYLCDDSQEFCYDDAHTEINLGQAIFDELMTGLPMMPLCAETCPGVAVEPASGVVEKPVDPRWEALRKLGKK